MVTFVLQDLLVSESGESDESDEMLIGLTLDASLLPLEPRPVTFDP